MMPVWFETSWRWWENISNLLWKSRISQAILLWVQITCWWFLSSDWWTNLRDIKKNCDSGSKWKPLPKKVNVPCTSQMFSISHHVLSFPTSIFLMGALVKCVRKKKIDTNDNPLPHIRAHRYFIFQTHSIIYKHSKTRELDRMYCLWGTRHT